MGMDATRELPVRGNNVGSRTATTANNDGFVQLGRPLRSAFPFDHDWTNLNHGSYGTIPNFIQARRRHYQDLYEARPDPFIREGIFDLIDESRAAVAKLMNAPVESIVFVCNATDGINTVLRNMVWNDDGKDVMIRFSTIYDACARAQDFVADFFNVGVREIYLEYPLEDEDIIRLFREQVKNIEAEGKRARLALFDVVSSNPGVVFPWESMVEVCRELGVLSLVDGAQGIGMVRLDLESTDPDFFVSNCHKWLHTPRGSAVFYVPKRNQHLIPSTLATARGYQPKKDHGAGRAPPRPEDPSKSHFVRNFEWAGTRDDSAYFCVKDAIAWRRDVLGGEDRVLDYTWDLNKRGIKHVAETLGTEYLDNSKGTLTNCSMGNVALPIWVGKEAHAIAVPGGTVLSAADAAVAFNWMQERMVVEYKTFMAVFVRWDRFWVRISSQVYLDIDDYHFAGRVLQELCERVAKGEFRSA